MEKEKLIAINCQKLNKEETKNIQMFLFDKNYQWHSSKIEGERKFKNEIDILIVDGLELFNGTESTINELQVENEVMFFNSPVEYLRHFKLKKIKTKIK